MQKNLPKLKVTRQLKVAQLKSNWLTAKEAFVFNSARYLDVLAKAGFLFAGLFRVREVANHYPTCISTLR